MSFPARKTRRVCQSQLPPDTLKQGECLKEVAPRTYEVRADGEVRHQFREDIMATKEPQDTQALENSNQSLSPKMFILLDHPLLADILPKHSKACTEAESCPVADHACPLLRRSVRQRRCSQRFKDFILS